jgi:hypothetical protein
MKLDDDGMIPQVEGESMRNGVAEERRTADPAAIATSTYIHVMCSEGKPRKRTQLCRLGYMEKGENDLSLLRTAIASTI